MFSSVQLLSCVCLVATPWTVVCQAPVFSTVSQSLLKFTFIESVMLPTQLILCHPFLLLCSVFPSVRVFSNGSALHIRWPKYWDFSFSKSPSNEYSGLIFFLRIDWFDLLAVRLLQPHGLNPPGSSVHEIFQARILKRVAIYFPRGSSQPRD